MAGFDYDRDQLTSKLLDILGKATDEELDSLVTFFEDPRETEASAPVDVPATLYTVVFDTAELDETYFQGFLNGANIRFKVISEVGNAHKVEYVGTSDALVRMAMGSFGYDNPAKAQELFDKIQPVKG